MTIQPPSSNDIYQLLDQLHRQLRKLKERGVSFLPRTTFLNQLENTEDTSNFSSLPFVSNGLSSMNKEIPETLLSKKEKKLPILPPDLSKPLLKGEEGLEQIRKLLGNCKRCSLHEQRTQLVFGQGNPTADIVFVGEGPGAEEDRTGLAFVGAAGELLTRMILAMGIKREDVYICNVVKSRPPGNRVPEANEMAICGPFLQAQLMAISPKIIVSLGRTPTQYLLETNTPMGKLRGSLYTWCDIPLIPTYHPAYLLRNPAAKKEVWEDLQKVMKFLGLSSRGENS